ncbi:MAG: hypothetical protein N0E54_13705 [Candidatus Thiodiazotropha taylori]|nr:hypothetical protein [Candidatus Thiodiazotropha endolucinida]MCW4229788.1 hypothetical protein [Candidatus Thiodiazotropha taylori]
MKIERFLIAFSLLYFAQVSVGSPIGYDCKVLHVYSLAEDGLLRASGFEKFMGGSTFTISNDTGEIVGDVVPTLKAKSIHVINHGSTENSFKSMALFEGQVQIIEVQEFIKGDEKPFVASSMGGAGIVTGICKNKN